MRDSKKFQQAVEETKAGIINRPYNIRYNTRDDLSWKVRKRGARARTIFVRW